MDYYEVFKADSEKQRCRSENRQKKLKIDRIKMLVVMGKIRDSVELAEKIGLSPKEYGKIVSSVN